MLVPRAAVLGVPARWWPSSPACRPPTAGRSALRAARRRWGRSARLRWFCHRTCGHCPARDAGLSRATGYRYLHEGIDLLAEEVPDPHDALDRCREQGLSHVVLDGALVSRDRVVGTIERGNDPWYSGKGRRLAGNLQFPPPPTAPCCGSPTLSPARCTARAARTHVLPALYAAARNGLPALADVGQTYLTRLLAKLNARDRAQLVILAYEAGLVAPSY